MQVWLFTDQLEVKAFKNKYKIYLSFADNDRQQSGQNEFQCEDKLGT
jgi:hypothetical protein